ncbi:hypothetical protein NHX12_033932, partial [Muraenolepis orangiensis]
SDRHRDGGSPGRRPLGDLRGAELVQVAERQLSQIQHVYGYVAHAHITPAKVDSPEVPLAEEAWSNPRGLNEVPAPPFSSLYSQSPAHYYQGGTPSNRKSTMNYIFGNNTLYPRSGRSGGCHGVGPGVKLKHGPKRGSSEDLPPPHAAPSPSSTATTSSPAPSSSASSSSSRWQQLLLFFSRRSAFADCITVAQA